MPRYRAHISPSAVASGACMPHHRAHMISPSGACMPCYRAHMISPSAFASGACISHYRAHIISPSGACMSPYRAHISPCDSASGACMPHHRAYISPSGACMSTGSLILHPPRACHITAHTYYRLLLHRVHACHITVHTYHRLVHACHRVPCMSVQPPHACMPHYRAYISPSDFESGACMSTGSLHVNPAG
jgi:hypothetical protein